MTDPLRDLGPDADADDRPTRSAAGRADELVNEDVAELAELAELAVGLAVGAGRLARRLRATGFTVSSKSTPTDLVTEVDRAVESWIAAELAARRPADGVLGEEGTGVAGGSVRWLVDPIDGTVNFALGLPYYAVSVAAEVGGRVVAGCVHNPESGEIYHARLGWGAYLDYDTVAFANYDTQALTAAIEPVEPDAANSAGGPEGRTAVDVDIVRLAREVTRDARRLTGSGALSLDRAVIGTGFSYDAAQRARQGAVVAALLPRVADIRRFGAASLELCAVAAGRLDGFYEAGLNEWDFAAGLLVAEEAGCAASGLRGRPAGTGLTAVAGPRVAAGLFDLLTELGADRV